MNTLLVLVAFSLGAIETHIHLINQNDGKPAVGVEVELHLLGEKKLRMGPTDGDGVARLDVNEPGYIDSNRREVKYLYVRVVDNRYEPVDGNARISWNTDEDLTRGYVIQVRHKGQQSARYYQQTQVDSQHRPVVETQYYEQQYTVQRPVTTLHNKTVDAGGYVAQQVANPGQVQYGLVWNPNAYQSQSMPNVAAYSAYSPAQTYPLAQTRTAISYAGPVVAASPVTVVHRVPMTAVVPFTSFRPITTALTFPQPLAVPVLPNYQQQWYFCIPQPTPASVIMLRPL
jgi:hypothetical protein